MKKKTALPLLLTLGSALFTAPTLSAADSAWQDVLGGISDLSVSADHFIASRDEAAPMISSDGITWTDFAPEIEGVRNWSFRRNGVLVQAVTPLASNQARLELLFSSDLENYEPVFEVVLAADDADAATIKTLFDLTLLQYPSGEKFELVNTADGRVWTPSEGLPTDATGELRPSWRESVLLVKIGGNEAHWAESSDGVHWTYHGGFLGDYTPLSGGYLGVASAEAIYW